MKFTSIAVAALFLANTQAVKINDDCKGKWCNKGLPYDLDVPTLNKAEADNVAKTQHFNGATKADAVASATAAASAKADAAAAFAGTSYKDKPAFQAAEAANAAAVKAKEAALDAKLKADDKKVADDLIAARKARDLAASTAAKAASDANLKANQERVAYEKDQLERGENQDRLKFVNEATAAKTSEIQGKHDERERANAALRKALASF